LYDPFTFIDTFYYPENFCVRQTYITETKYKKTTLREEGLILAYNLVGRQNIMVEGHDGAKSLTSWQPASKKEGKN
jgi:hypothetical protein